MMQHEPNTQLEHADISYVYIFSLNQMNAKLFFRSFTSLVLSWNLSTTTFQATEDTSLEVEYLQHHYAIASLFEQ